VVLPPGRLRLATRPSWFAQKSHKKRGLCFGSLAPPNAAAQTFPSDGLVLDGGRVVGRIFLHAQGPEGTPWFWTITAPDIPPSVDKRGYSTTREQAMTDFKARWSAGTNPEKPS
jgi:hypothetical protein